MNSSVFSAGSRGPLAAPRHAGWSGLLSLAAVLLLAGACGKKTETHEQSASPAAGSAAAGSAAAAGAGAGAGSASSAASGVLGVDIGPDGRPLPSAEEEVKLLEAARATGQNFSIKMFMSELGAAYCKQNMACGLDTFASVPECVDKTGFVKSCPQQFENCEAEVPGDWLLECVIAVKRMRCDAQAKRVLGDLPAPCLLVNRIAAASGQ